MFKFGKSKEPENKPDPNKIRFTKETPQRSTTIEDELNHTADLARQCLASPLFDKYKKSLEIIEVTLIHELIQEARDLEYNGKSIEKFGVTCLAKLIKLHDIKSLKLAVDKDISRSIEKSDDKEKKL